LIVGYLNAQIGKELMIIPTIGQESMHETSDYNGCFVISRELVISITYLLRKNIHKYK